MECKGASRSACQGDKFNAPKELWNVGALLEAPLQAGDLSSAGCCNGKPGF
jgi:hypothetical protein